MSVNAGPELQEIWTDAVGYNTLAGETKVQLLSEPWPVANPPPAYASLFTIASVKGLVAAASPSSLVIASTSAVREAFYADTQAKNKIKPFTPQVTLSIPQVSHVAFSSDESSLVIAADQGGGLAVYDVQAVLEGKQDSTFQLATNGTSVRALVPNPAPESAHLFAVVLANGHLLIADLKQGQLINTPNGSVFREGVSCVSWSSRGKQLVAGLADGTAVQYDPQGNVKAQIPRPPQLDQQLPITSIYWVTNDDFLLIHTPVDTDMMDSEYHIMHRDKASASFTAQKIGLDPCPANGSRVPAQHFVSRLKNFPPHLDEMLIVSSTASADVGMFTKSSAPLAPDAPINAFTITSMEVDSRRITLPMSDTRDDDPSIIGQDLDLSAKNTVARPIPQEEIEESATPLPALMILNDEGVLCAWWVVYNDAVRQKIAYPGLGEAVIPAPSNTPSLASFGSPAATPMSTSFTKPAQPAFGSPAFGKPAQPAFGSPSFGKPAQPAFGSPSFGKPAQPAFGQSAFGSNSAPATATFSNASPAFGSASALGSKSGNASFGSIGGMGSKGSVWGNSPSASATPAFGQSSVPFGGSAASGPSAFAALAGAKSENKPSTSFGFANSSAPSGFAQLGGANKSLSFGGFGDGKQNKPSPLSSGQTSDSIKPASQPTTETKEESMDDDTEDDTVSDTTNKASEPEKPEATTEEKQPQQSEPEKPKFAFGQPSDKAQSSPFAQFAKPATSPFAQTPAPAKTSSPFAQSGKSETSPFTKSSSSAASPSVFGQPSKQVGFQFGKPSDRPASPSRQSSDKPSSKLPTLGGFKLGSTFQGDGSAKDDVRATKKDGASPFGSMFGNILGEAAKEKNVATPIKKEPGTEEPKLQDISATPASSSKQGVTEGSSKTADKNVDPEEAPLPPDFTMSKPKETEEDDLPPIAGSPPVDLAEDAAQLSPPASDDGSWEEEDGSEEEGEEEEEEEEEGEGEDDDEEGEEEEDEEEEEEEDEDEEEDHTIEGSKAANTSFFPSHSTTPAGLPKGPFFAPPSKKETSPRSPSPVRTEFATLAARPTSRQTAQPVSVPSLKPQNRPASVQRAASPPPPEAGELSDDEDVRVRELLASEVEPTKELEPFIAHQDYVGHVSKPGLGGQIERVYRDINSMIDTLGLNARTLEAFIKGHESQYKQPGRERSDLEDADGWCLVEIKDLVVVEKEIGADLENGKVEEVASKLDELTELQKDASRLRAKTAEMRKQIGARADPQQRAAHRASSLNNEAQMQQNELREGVSKVQKLLQDAEEALSVLRADLAAVPTKMDGNAGQRVPTVEAVTKTILKMTAMIEQKSGDVDVLEMQLRRLPRGMEGLSLGESNEDLRSSVRSIRPLERTSSPFGTPPASRGKGASSGTNPMGMSGMFGRFGGSVRRDKEEFGRSSIMMEGTPRRKMADVSTEEVKRYQEKMRQRKNILGALKQTMEKKGSRVTGVNRDRR